MLDMHDGGEGMHFFILDSSVSLVFKVCVTQRKGSPQDSAQVEPSKKVAEATVRLTTSTSKQSISTLEEGTSKQTPI